MKMKFYINAEIDKLNRFVNGKEILLFENYSPSIHHSGPNNKTRYLSYILELTYKHPEIEIYLERLLENFSIAELNNFDNSRTILHMMMYRFFNISLNTFEIIINLGVDVNSQNRSKNTPLHIMKYAPLDHMVNIIGLFVKHGANLNILNNSSRTVLDEILYKIMEWYLDKHAKILIMTMIDFGAKTNNPHEKTDKNILEFVESYRSNNIKPAIKK